MVFDDYNGTMFSTKWRTSTRKYKVIADKDVKIPTSDGLKLSCDVFRPESKSKFPAILGWHCYHQSGQTSQITPVAISSAQWKHPNQERTNASLESGDPNFFVRRGYVHVVCNARGTGKSEGEWQNMGKREVQDVYEAIEWIAAQPWCDGNVGMFGVSYFAMVQFMVAALAPPSLKALFCPWGMTDPYRDLYYRGGLLTYMFPIGWSQTSLVYSNCRPRNFSREELGEDAYRRAIAEMLQEEDLKAVPEIVQALRNPDAGSNAFIVDVLLHPLYDRYHEERTVNYKAIKIPAYIGACWANYGLHLPGAFRSWENLDVPKKMIIGPPIYLDRPLYQLQHEAVRWFDHWLKGMESGIMDEPPIRIFIMGTDEWKNATEWPLPETKWTPFFLHENGLLSEHEHWPNEGSDSFGDSPWMRGSLKYSTPPIVEKTEIVGPIVLNLYASTTDTEIFWNVSLLEIDPDGNERILTKGWLRGSHREIDVKRSKPWQPYYPHKKAEPLTPGEIYEFTISLVATGNLFKAGARIGLKVSGVDDPPKNPMELICTGTLKRQSVSRITVYRNADYPSALILPVTKGNILQTYMSGGKYPG
jgi:putative CocE/NonD family hydrolase